MISQAHIATHGRMLYARLCVVVAALSTFLGVEGCTLAALWLACPQPSFSPVSARTPSSHTFPGGILKHNTLRGTIAGRELGIRFGPPMHDSSCASQAEISEKESALEDLVKGFEQLLVEKAKAGDMPRVERKPFMRGDEAYNEDRPFSSRASNRGVPYRDQYDAGGGGGGYGGAFGGDHHGDDSHRGDSFGAGYGGGGGGGYNRRRGGRGGGGGHREYREAGGHRDGGGYGGGADGGFSSYGSRINDNRGGFGGDGGGGYHRHYPMHADSEDYHPLSER